ncbi:hypothetical protein B1A85_08330 [Chroococcidiopsis sp. TS-821]|nr:hypothetical protein B1A85_08330 [Chroococcidiopsis sp. TS-821]
MGEIPQQKCGALTPIEVIFDRFDKKTKLLLRSFFLCRALQFKKIKFAQVKPQSVFWESKIQ